MLTARFDDLRPGRKRSFGFGEPVGTVVAHTRDEVQAAIIEADRIAQEGFWLAGMISYEAAPAFDSALTTAPASSFPLVSFNVYETVINDPEHVDGSGRVTKWTPNIDEATYVSHIDQIRESIRQGDTYQVNYTLRMRGRLDGDAQALYRDLIVAQSGGFGAYLKLEGWQLVSASPELFFRWDRSGKLVTRPMKGTTRRGRFTDEDNKLVDELITSEKERAENVMIVDLIRNDLGRVAEFGSVAVSELFAVEQYNTVWQMTSEIEAQARPDVGLYDVFAALFPSGSVTGAPKAATMGIIAALEQVPRNVYCGAIGVLAPPTSYAPRAQFNVPIRTVLVESRSREAEYGVGGGITYDSTSGGEYAEAMLKTEVLGKSTERFTLLETMRWDPDSDGIWLLERHLDRLANSGRYLGFSLDLDAIRTALVGLSLDDVARIRLLANDNGFSVESTKLVEQRSPVRLEIDVVPVDPRDWRLFHKTTSRQTYQDAARRHPGADDVVLINSEGNITETTIGNLAVEIDGTWYTPPITDGLLPGTYRAELLEAGQLRERSISTEDMRRCEKLAVINSVQGWRDAVL
ncbi:MAG: aminodeoxychorismate synthase component I, partial [Acidimicrobiia bacterium]|nr:aminodeoxychorismate synthase component I [Acidimicrobiia bacterium]